MSVVALSGNPRTGSRTLVVARALADRVAAALGESRSEVELADIAPRLFDTKAPEVDQIAQRVSRASVLIVATPVYKASYTGLLKAFFDRYRTGALRGVLAVPATVSASPAHAFVAEHLLRPLLVELGASAPTRSFAVTEQQLTDLDVVVDAWAEDAVPVLSALVRDPEPVGATS